jgi:hypothetical protein
MRKSILLSLTLCLCIAMQAQDKPVTNAGQGDAIKQKDWLVRLRLFDAKAFRMAAEDMETPADKWENTLSELAANKTSLTSGIRNNDKDAIRKTESLFEKLDRILLDNPLLRNREIVVVGRKFATDARKRMNGDAGLVPHNFQNNSSFYKPKGGWNNSLIVLSGFGDNIRERELYHPGDSSIISDVEMHYSGDRLMYSSTGTNNHWQLFELDIAAGKSRQITPDTYKDFDSFDGCYTTDGKYIFCSTATFLGLPCTNGADKMCGLFVYDPATGISRQLTFDQDSNWNPVMMNNGQIRPNPWYIYDMHGNVWEWTRSEYVPYPFKNNGRNETSAGTQRTVRGGSWYDRPHKCTSSYRMGYNDFQQVYNVGFRVVMYQDDALSIELTTRDFN